MPAQYPGNAITKAARAKSGGGFESAIEVTPPSATPFFEDGFESGDFSKTATNDGSVWGWSPVSVTVDTNNSLTGSNSANFTFGPNAPLDDAWVELAFSFGKSVSEAWAEYDLFVPSNFANRSPSDNAANNKFFQFNFDGSTYQALTVEFTAQGSGKSALRRFLAASEDPATGQANWPADETEFPNIADFIGAGCTLVPGNWHQVRLHFKSSTDGTSADGLAELFIDGVLIRSLAWPFWKISTSGQINGGYVLGYANSGYDNATEFRVDNFKAYDSDPGWT